MYYNDTWTLGGTCIRGGAVRRVRGLKLPGHPVQSTLFLKQSSSFVGCIDHRCHKSWLYKGVLRTAEQ